jgi:hypothetical protein
MASTNEEHHVTFVGFDTKESNRRTVEQNITKNTKAKTRKAWINSLKSDNCTSNSTNTMKEYNKKHGKAKKRKHYVNDADI